MRGRGSLLFFFVLTACVEGDPGPAGAPGTSIPGDKGEPGDPGGVDGGPSISGILPSSVFLEHDVDVTVTGFATDWQEGDEPAVDFGPGITAGPLSIASPTSFLTRLVIDADAELGPRDVTIDGLLYKGTFNIDAPLTLDPLPEWGSPKQGSVLAIQGIQNDVHKPFAFTPLRVFLRDGATEINEGVIANFSPYSFLYYQFIDVFSPLGTLDGAVESGVPLVRSLQPDALTVEARQATVLTGGVTTATIPAPRETLLYRVDSQQDEWLHFRVAAQDPAARPTFFSLPKSGSFKDRAFFATIDFTGLFREFHVLARPDDENYLVYFDGSPTSGYDVDVSVERAPPTGLLVDSIDKPGLYDWYQVQATEGETLVVIVGDGPTAICGVHFAAAVYVVQQTPVGGTEILLDEYSVCPGQPSPIEVTIPADGKYMVGIGASVPFCNGCLFDYSAIVQVVP